MSDLNVLEQPFPRPLSGEYVADLPLALIPARTALTGNYVVLESQDARKHAGDLFHSSHDSEAGLAIWDYLAYGPWPDETAFAANIRASRLILKLSFMPLRPLARITIAARVVILILIRKWALSKLVTSGLAPNYSVPVPQPKRYI